MRQFPPAIGAVLILGLASLATAADAAVLRVEGPIAEPLVKYTGSGGGIGGVGAGAGVGAVGSGGFGGGIGARGGVSSSFGSGAQGGWGSGLKSNVVPHPSVIWYPPDNDTKEQRATCDWLYRKAQNTGTHYWRGRYNDCIR
jgi:hypothetical protein